MINWCNMRFSTFTVLIAFCFWATTALGAGNSVTGITITTADPNDICIGDSVTYKVNYTGGDPVQSVQWWYTCTDCTPQNQVNWGSGPYTQRSTTETMVGNFQIKATVTFQNYPTPQTYQGTATVNVTVNPPNKVEVDPQFLNKPTPILGPGATQPNLWVKFKIKRNSR